MSYNHLTAAIYQATIEMPQNALVKKAVADGIGNCTIFRRDVPLDALQYFINVHNSCHDNGGHSWIQQLEDAGGFARGWMAYAQDHNITATQYGTRA